MVSKNHLLNFELNDKLNPKRGGKNFFPLLVMASLSFLKSKVFFFLNFQGFLQGLSGTLLEG